MKKIVALSTLRQLGLIITIIRVRLKELAFFHLLAHAFFKAITFIAIGAVIHRNSGFQDVRWGGAFVNFFISFVAIRVASIRLAGIPFISAFFTKEFLLEYLMLNATPLCPVVLFLGRVPLTAAYRIRLIRLVYLKVAGAESMLFRQDIDKIILFAVAILIAPAIFGGIRLTKNFMSVTVVPESRLSLKLIVLTLMGAGVLLGTTTLPRNYFRNLMWGLNTLS